MGRGNKTVMSTRKSKAVMGKKAVRKNVASDNEDEGVPEIKAIVVDSIDSSDESEDGNGGKEDDMDVKKKYKSKMVETLLSSSDESDDSSDEELTMKKRSIAVAEKKKKKEDCTKTGKKVMKTIKAKSTVKKVGMKSKKNVVEKKGTEENAGSNKESDAEVTMTTTVADDAKDLACFGITAATLVEGKGKQVNGNISALRIVIIDGVAGHCDILLRCEATGQNNVNSSWCEKLFADSIKQSDSWASRLNVSGQAFNWYDNDTMKVNRNGYPIRLFHIPVSSSASNLSSENVTNLCNHICRMLSNYPRNTEKITYDERTAKWINGKAVWADVVGTTKAASIIRISKGNPYQGFFEENEEYILTYFRRNNKEIMKQFFAPIEENETEE